MTLMAEDLQRILDAQQKQSTELITAVLGHLQSNRFNSTKEGTLMVSLSNSITKFVFDAKAEYTFETWFKRYKDLFIIDAASLGDTARVRLLLRRLHTSVHERDVNYILPKNSKDFLFQEMIDDYTTLAGIKKRECERFQLAKLMENQFKYLIFVCSLQAPSEADIRLKLLHKTKTEPKATLQILAEESHCLINLKHDTKLVEASNSAVIEAVKGKHEQNPTQYIPRESSQPDKGKSPPSPCWIFRYRLRTDHYNTKDMESLGFTAASEENHSSVRSELRETAHHWLVRVTIQTLGFAHKILSISKHKLQPRSDLSTVPNNLCFNTRSLLPSKRCEDHIPCQTTRYRGGSGSSRNSRNHKQGIILKMGSSGCHYDIFSILNGRKISSQIDLIDAYLHVEVEKESRELLTLNTQRGLYIYNRLPFGVKSVPRIFQQIVDTLLVGTQGAIAYLDDIILAGKEEFGFNIRPDKYNFALPKVKHLGFIIAKNGRQPDPAKIETIRKMPSPSDVSLLRPFLDLVNYYSSFMENMNSCRGPLDDLLKKDAEKNYGRIGKEGLALAFAVKKFHHILHGHHFKLFIEYKSLFSIFGSKKGIPATTLLPYDFQIEYRSTTSFAQDVVIAAISIDQSVRQFLQDSVRAQPITPQEIRQMTATDGLLQELIQYLQSSWPDHIRCPRLMSYFRRRDSLSITDECLLFA
uniref:Reverse transcriptase domain-containing protein n=1 Tax=Heterorhabditis bacteriophora TaxID=37862 RepID=A0A1I7WID2_HETBA